MQTLKRPSLVLQRTAWRTALPSARRLVAPVRADIPSRPAGGGARLPPPPYSEAAAGNNTPAVAQPVASTPAAPAPAAAAAPAGLTAVTVSGPVAVQSALAPAAIYEAAAALGGYKGSLPFWKIVLLGVAAGCYVALGAALLLTVGPNCMGIAAQNPGLAKYITGAIGFPYALLIILSCGAELFTGNTAVLTAAVYEGKATFKQLLKSWIGSYLGNIIGCGLGVVLLLATGMGTTLFANGITALSTVKVTTPLPNVIAKALLANWFVCLAVWQYLGAQSFGGRFIACLGPVSAFVCCGFEHCIANMVFVPLGILTNVPGVTWEAFIYRNLIPVTIANIVAGAGFVATLYSLLYGSLGKKISGKSA